MRVGPGHCVLAIVAVAALVCACAGSDPVSPAVPLPESPPAPASLPTGLPAGLPAADPQDLAVPDPLPAPEFGPESGPPLPGTSADGLPRVISRGPAERPWIALTFDSNMTDAMLRRLDSGEVASYASPEVLDVLQQTRTPATFFLAGKWVQRYPELTRRIAADPAFELASHSYAHAGFTADCFDLGSLAPQEMAADVERSFETLAPFGGRQTRYFRFPGGCYDDQALRALAAVDCTVVQFSIVADDPFNDDPQSIITNVLGNAHNGGIAVLHITGANAPRTADALPAIIDGLRGSGYELVTLSELLAG